MTGKRLPLLLILVLTALNNSGSGEPPQNTHELKLVPENVHWGYYDGRLEPVLRIDSGDTVVVDALIARGLERLYMAGAGEDEIPEALKVVEEAVTDRGPGAHPLTGPIYVTDAEPGDMLEVRILDFEFLHPFGIGGFIPGAGTLPDDFPYSSLRLIRFDLEEGTAEIAPGVKPRLAPFFGSIGVAPNPLNGRISSGPPGPHVGNLDNKELVAGTTLYTPVHVPGALLSMGDGHAMQGDGEITVTALETSMRGTRPGVPAQERVDPLAAGGNTHPLHVDGAASQPRGGGADRHA